MAACCISGSSVPLEGFQMMIEMLGWGHVGLGDLSDILVLLIHLVDLHVFSLHGLKRQDGGRTQGV